jgi:hypothetical protein
MVDIAINESVAQAQQKALAVLFVNHPETRKRIRKIVREELKDATKRLREDARYELPNDPRKAYRAVRASIYRKILGGNVSILNPRRAGQRYQLIKPRKLDQNPFQRGGNRVPRNARTESVDTYFGKDRAFILRFLNSGTDVRMAGSRGGRLSGNRGSITARNWFGNMAPHEMELAAENLSNVIEEELAEAYKEMDKT